MLKHTEGNPTRRPRIGSAWTGRWTPLHIVLFVSVVTIGLAGFILRTNDVVGSSVSFAIYIFCLLALIVGDAWLARRDT